VSTWLVGAIQRVQPDFPVTAANRVRAVTETWRALVDVDVLADWMTGQGLGDMPIVNPRALTGGTQNILVAFERGGVSMVLRRPPAHAQTDSEVVIKREARLLAALGATELPHPHFIAGCSDPAVLGASFYVMEAVEGYNAHPTLPPPFDADPALRRRMGLALADCIASLGRLDYAALGLSDFGKPDGFLQRQVARWRKQLDGYIRYSGWRGPAALGDVDGVGEWLERNRPAHQLPGIIHGDVHLANALYRFDAPKIAALVDWELSTIGDPLIDLGWLLCHWPDANGEGAATTGTAPWQGFPSARDLVARYAETSGRDVSAINWYAVLACYKRAVIIEGTYARALAGLADMETGRLLHGRATGLIDRAFGFIAA
jgi:aminoglycoside phosphotransferase (APT) family kinase protein